MMIFDIAKIFFSLQKKLFCQFKNNLYFCQKISVKKMTKNRKRGGKYINPLTDFGFKFIFGTKEYLIYFLNAVLKIEGGIVDLEYGATERKGRFEKDRTTIFDLYCTTGNGASILIEMQSHSQEYFGDRALYYASRMVQEQGENKKGNIDWNFELNPVISVNILNFKIPVAGKPKADKSQKTQGDKYAKYVKLVDVETSEVFNKNLSFVFLELPRFKKKENELKTPVEEWMFILKNMAKLNDLPEALRIPIFEKMFLKAEVANLSPEDRKIYDESLKRYKDMYTVISERDRKIDSLTTQVTNLSGQNANLSTQNANLSTQVTNLSTQNAALAEEIVRLRKQLGK
jgi:predicted transposase/invertase (TIGR01784 family)